MPIIAQNEKNLLSAINIMTKEMFSQYLNECDDETIDAVKDTIRKAYILNLKLPSFLPLISEREEHILDTLGKNNRLSM